MSYLDLDNLSKSFKDDKIISNLNAKIEKGEFFVVFGPSGSGKTVLLRLLSGIMMADSGEIKMDNQIINELHPEERDVSMAFQNFALYPHMKAYENIASPLRAKNKNMPENEIHEKVNEIANLLKVQFQTTLLIFKDNKEIYRSVGETTEDLIYEAIKSSIKI